MSERERETRFEVVLWFDAAGGEWHGLATQEQRRAWLELRIAEALKAERLEVYLDERRDVGW